MPSRVVREGILRSRRIDALSCEAELFYRRLISVVDDYGRYEADPVLLRSDVFPLRIDRVSSSDMEAWLQECAKGAEPLIQLYWVKGVRYLEITGFKQRLRAMQALHPSPDQGILQPPENQRPTDDGQMTGVCQTDVGQTSARNETKRIETKRTEPDGESQKPGRVLEMPVAGQQPFPEAAAAVRDYFPSADDLIICKICNTAVEECGNATTDAEIAGAIRESYRDDQKSVALWLSTVSGALKRKRLGRASPVRPYKYKLGLNPMASMR